MDREIGICREIRQSGLNRLESTGLDRESQGWLDYRRPDTTSKMMKLTSTLMLAVVLVAAPTLAYTLSRPGSIGMSAMLAGVSAQAYGRLDSCLARQPGALAPEVEQVESSSFGSVEARCSRIWRPIADAAARESGAALVEHAAAVSPLLDILRLLPFVARSSNSD